MHARAPANTGAAGPAAQFSCKLAGFGIGYIKYFAREQHRKSAKWAGTLAAMDNIVPLAD